MKRMSRPANKMIADLAKGEFIVFAGAGVPMESGPPITWKDLLATFKEKEPKLTTRDIDEVGEDEYPDYAQEIFDALKKEGKEANYYEIIGAKLRATNARFSAQQRDIIESAQHVVTTNFDDSFKKAVERELEGGNTNTFKVQDLPELNTMALRGKYSISYLHGRINEKCIVFRTEDYTAFYPSQAGSSTGNDNLEQFLRHLYEEHTIVFVGVSFNDECLISTLNIFYNKVKQNDEVGREKKVSYKSKLDHIQHYAWMQEDSRLEANKKDRAKGGSISDQRIEENRRIKRERLEELKIKTVTYKEHVDWTDWLENIRELRRKYKKSNQDVSVVEDPSQVGIKAF